MSNNVCRVCTNEIMQMCRKNTGLCCEICEKAEKEKSARVITDLTLYSWGPSYTGLGTIESVTPVVEVEEGAKMRPDVPCLLGKTKADELEEIGKLMVGDIRNTARDQYHVWTNNGWEPCEKPEKVA